MSCVCGHFEVFFLPFSVGSFQCWVVSTSSIPAHIWQEADSRGTIHTYRRIIRVWIHLNSSPLNFTRKPSFHSLFDTGQSGCFTSQNALLHWNEWQQFLLWWQWKWRQGRFLGLPCCYTGHRRISRRGLAWRTAHQRLIFMHISIHERGRAYRAQRGLHLWLLWLYFSPLPMWQCICLTVNRVWHCC